MSPVDIRSGVCQYSRQAATRLQGLPEDLLREEVKKVREAYANVGYGDLKDMGGEISINNPAWYHMFSDIVDFFRIQLGDDYRKR